MGLGLRRGERELGISGLASENLILVARIAGAFGVKGEVRLTSYTADPMALLGYRDLKRENGQPGLTLASARPHKGGIVGRAREIETREQAEALRGLQLYVPRDALPPPEDEDEFYLVDLIGLSVETPQGDYSTMGRVAAFVFGGPHEPCDRLRVVLDLGLDRGKIGALGGEAQGPGSEVGSDIALGEAAHGDGALGLAVRRFRARQAVAEQIAADREAAGENQSSHGVIVVPTS